MTQILGWLEEGTASIPTRPIIAPVFARLEGGESELLDGLQSTIRDNLEKLLQ